MQGLLAAGALAGAAALGLIRGGGGVASVRSRVDQHSYIVRREPDMQEAADLLGRLNARAQALLAHLSDRHPDSPAVRRMLERYDRGAVSEGSHDSGYTSYSVDKGRQIVMCLRDRTGDKSLHGENLLFYVLMHELAHLSTDEVGHTSEFWSNFAFIRREAAEIGLYQDTDYSQAPAQYCGITIRSR